jgi:hypothetical protein
MATYYLTITPIDTLSTSTYSIYYDSITFSNLIASGVPQSTLTGTGYSVDSTGRTSAIVKNEDPDCCCDAQSFVFPTPSPTATPTTTPTSQPTTATPTTQPTTSQPTPQPTTPQPTTPQPTTPQPTTPQPTSAYCGSMGVFELNSGTGTQSNTGYAIAINSSNTSGTTIYTGTLVATTNNCLITLRAFSGTGGSTSQGSCSITGGPSGGALSTATAGPSGGVYTSDSITIDAGTYSVTLSGFFNAGTNPPTSANNVYLYFS